jgi:hypothetical protein
MGNIVIDLFDCKGTTFVPRSFHAVYKAYLLGDANHYNWPK